MFQVGCWVNPLTACTLIHNDILMNGDEFHEMQETVLLADIKMCYDLIWLCINVYTQSEPRKICLEYRRMNSWSWRAIRREIYGDSIIIIIILTFSKTYSLLVYLPSNILSTLHALMSLVITKALRKSKYREGKPRSQSGKARIAAQAVLLKTDSLCIFNSFMEISLTYKNRVYLRYIT